MNNQVIQIAARIRELREILDVPQEALAQKIGVDIEEYKRYESAQDDIPIGVLYGVAAELRVDPTELLTGEAPRMDEYLSLIHIYYDHNGIGGNGLTKKFYHRVHIIITSLPSLHPAGAAVSGKILFARERAVSG